MKNIVILGSTGSLGRQAIEVLKKYKKDFKIIGLSAYKNEKLLRLQAKTLRVPPKNLVLSSRDPASRLVSLAKLKDADIIINVLSGISGIAPALAALKAGKTLLLGNKEAAVAQGLALTKFAKNLIPLDSEHNAVFEILKYFPKKTVKSITLPCSGGPFLGKTPAFLKNITVSQTLSHPKWKMGKKISVESATLINKGFEIIEAHYLFNLPVSKIKVKIHPQCLIHAIVEFGDGSSYAYVSKPDMREHIENALLRAISTTPRTRSKIRPFIPEKFKFSDPDHAAFPGIRLVLKAFRSSKKNLKPFLKKEEKVINDFLAGKIAFPEIFTRLK
ncbi:MAG: 1-deoxy-D-xylulose-5-phosphate reductoisomerase [Candidatus Peregrinibacteria bacterium]